MPASTSSYVPKLPPSKGKGKDDKSFLDAVASAMDTLGQTGVGSRSGPTSIPAFTPSRSATPASKPKGKMMDIVVAAVDTLGKAGVGSRSGPTSIPAFTPPNKEDSTSESEKRVASTKTTSGKMDEEEAPRAKVVEDDEVVQSFFAKTHGGTFDPNSRSDRSKMDKILGMVNADPKLLSMSPGKFAMKVYTSK